MVGGSKEAEMKELEAFLKALGQGGTPTGKPGEGPALPGAPGGMPDLASLGLSQQLGEIPSWAAPNPDGGIRDLSNGSGSTSFFTWPKIIIGAGLAAAAAWYLRGKGEGGGILQGIKNLWARLTGKASVVTEETKNLQKTTQ
jgi:hypothetical protein